MSAIGRTFDAVLAAAGDREVAGVAVVVVYADTSVGTVFDVTPDAKALTVRALDVARDRVADEVPDPRFRLRSVK